jgi:carboxynorspermidine decarboxylase
MILPSNIPSPCFVVDYHALERNLAIFDKVQQNSGAKCLLALKGFAMFATFPLLKQTLYGVCASSINEAILGHEEFGREVHTFAPAYDADSLKQCLKISDHLIFNSFSQFERFKNLREQFANQVKFGLRINPEHSEADVALYDPCTEFSRLGIVRAEFENKNLAGISGLHFHTLCEQDSYALERTLDAVEGKFGKFIAQMKWVNFGGGHHISRENYDVAHLCKLIKRFKDKYNVEVYLEPGEAVALNAGILVTTVLDIIYNGMFIAILDTSAATHMSDVLEMPYRPEIKNAGQYGEKAYTYRLGGNSCLAGDIIADYSFDKPLKIGDKLQLLDMAHYSMVKTTTFNGVKLPAIALYRNKKLEIIKEFRYEDFRNRLS